MEQQQKKIKKGKYPASVKLGVRTAAWRVNGNAALVQLHSNREGTYPPQHTPSKEAPQQQADAILAFRVDFRWLRIRFWMRCRYFQ